MKKTMMLLAIFILTFSFTSITHAQMGMMGNGWGMMGGSWQNNVNVTQNQELTDILQTIYTSQNVSSQAAVDCSKVSDDQFEKLGDAYMGTMLPNEQQHEAMDNMMGGEGSASLRQAHINMGRSYLGCWSGYSSGPVSMPMMGGYGMMGTGGFGQDITRFNDNSMMNYGFGGFGGGLFMILFWILVIAGIIALIKYFMSSNKPMSSSKSALDILKERYAKGEIDKEEFETKKKDL